MRPLPALRSENQPSHLRKDLIGAAILFVFLNLTLFPYIFGGKSIQDSITTSSIYPQGSTKVTPPNNSVARFVDTGAAAWCLEPDLIIDRVLMLVRHEPPIWNPYAGYGTPLAADMQSQPYSPLAWIAILLPGPEGYDIFIMLRAYAAGLFMFLFLRRFMDLAPSLVGGAAFMYTGYFWIYLTMPEVSVEVLIPALLFAGELLASRPGYRSAAIFAITFASCVLGGMPESAILAVAFGGAYFLVRVASSGSFRANIRKIGLAFAGGSLLAVGLCAVLIGPFFEYVGRSFNTHSNVGSDLQGIGADVFSLDYLSVYVAPLIHGPTWNNIFNGFNGHFGGRGFFGTAATTLAVIGTISVIRGLWSRREAGEPPWLFFTCAAFMLLSKRFGFPWANWIGYLPGFRLVQFQKYEEAALACAISVLAAVGTARLLRGVVSTFEAGLGVLIVLIGLSAEALTMQGAFFALHEHANYYINALALCLAILLVLLVTIAIITRASALALRVAAVLLVGSVVVEMNAGYIIPMLYVITWPSPQADAPQYSDAPFVSFLQKNLGTERFFAEDLLLYPNWATAFQLQDVRSLDALYDERYLPFVQSFFTKHTDEELDNRFGGVVPTEFNDPIERRFLQMSSIRYVATEHPIGGGSNHALSVAFADGDIGVYRFADPLPRLSAFSRVTSVQDASSALATIRSASFDPRASVVVEGSSGRRASVGTGGVVAGTIDRYEATDVLGTITVAVPSVVMLNDTWFPGWNAYVDGRPETVLHADYLFRGVPVGAGTHHVEFKYEPATFRIGAFISLCALLMTIGFLSIPMLLARRAGAVGNKKYLDESDE